MAHRAHGDRAMTAPKGKLTDKEFAARMKAEGYLWPRKLSTGEWAGVQRFMFTHGLCVGLDETGYRTRYCYEDWGEALIALATWDGRGDPPGDWIKQKGGGVDRTNPRRFKDIPIVTEGSKMDPASLVVRDKP